METIKIHLQHESGKKDHGFLMLERGQDIVLDLDTEEAGGWSVTSNDYFHALSILREAMAAEGWRVLCKGAQVNVYPSRMSFQMGLGRMAYEMELGKPVGDPVDIFDPGDPEKIGSPEEQKAFFECWQESF